MADFLAAVQNGSIDNNWGNPGPEDDVQPSEINFSLMAPGTIFTMAGEQYRYLENQGDNNHMIIRNAAIRNTNFDNMEQRANDWYAGLDPAVHARVRPVSNNFVTGSVNADELTWTAGQWRWLPTNLDAFPEVAADETRLAPSGSPRAFILSLADVVRLSGPGRAFSNHEERVGSGPEDDWWLLRTLATDGAWRVQRDPATGVLSSHHAGSIIGWGGVRPALIVRQ